MKKLLLLTCLAMVGSLFGQSDGCSSASLITVSANCSSPTAGTTTGATQTIPGCVGNSDDDVWYQFVATSTAHQIIVDPSVGMDPVVQLFEGACATLVSLVCKDAGLTGDDELINYNGLVIGNTYRVRVYDYYAGSGSGNFTICVTNPPPAPANDGCTAAITLNVNSTCTNTLGTTDGASETLAGCSGSADDDVWYSFVATNSLQNVQVQPIGNLDLVFQVYEGTCGSLVSLACIDNTFTGQTEQSDIVGLTPGLTYFVRVYDYYQGTTGDFNICITGTPTPTPTNDEPCNAIQLPAVTAQCQFSNFTTVGASATLSAPTPASCIGGGGAAIGGFSGSSSDVWFTITVPASGNIDVTAQPNGGAGSINDGVMALYSGPNCNTLTQITCSDDNNYPGSGNDLLPLITASGLVPGSTVYLRYWGFGTSVGTFGICASTATNDDCANALYICDINGYSASTSGSYTPDRPDNMRGNNEDVNGVNMPDGVNTGGIFGQGGTWGTGAPFYDVIINNNSWIKFTAAATTATLTVSIYDCWIGNYPSGGIQMQIFEGTNCTNFVPVSNFEESSTGFVITANGLTVGNDYYLMVDGYAGDICNYTITANSGVQFPDIANVAPICVGQSVTLTAPPGATSYEWQHNGATTQSVTVTPSTTETYYCEVTGLCDYKQTLDVDVTVNPLPNIQISNGSSVSICEGNSIALNATGGSTYIWSTAQTGASISVSPTTTTNYTLTGTDANGCVNTDDINVAVNSNPVLTASPTASNADCGASNGALSGAVVSGTPSLSYDWTNGTSSVGSAQNLTGVPAGTYYLNVTDGNSCSSTFGPFGIINPGAPPAPTISVSTSSPCLGASSQLVASSVPGATFSWTGPNSFASSNSTIDLTNVTQLEAGTYCVAATVAGCTGPASCETITIPADPNVDISALGDDSTICQTQDFELTASGASSYSWTGPNGFSSTSTTINQSNVGTAEQGYYAVVGTDANGCSASDSMLITIIPNPTISVTADLSSQTYCNGGIASLTATGASTYSWTGPNGYTATSDLITLLNLTASEQGYYVVSGTDAEGCSTDDSLFVTVVTDVPAQSPSDTTICPGEFIILNGSGGQSFTWSGPGGYSSSEQNPTVTNNATFDNAGLYTLTVVDANGCLGYDSTYVEVTGSGDCLFIPNLFTPDKDNLNDFWVIPGIEAYVDAEVSIYNRWGNVVYTASPYNSDWDGTVNAGASLGGNDGRVPPGTYFYIINLNSGDKPPYKGYVEVQY
ncbi:MAG: gliding motility-associated C-terminal domain-containing protein [Crocinitomicaceae bacterium]|nr:gliding motility-associated C-terminal domain-containing protein [Crocinitomicaceae bacterium]